MRTFPSEGPGWKDAEEGSRGTEEPVWRDEVQVSNDLVEHSWWCLHDVAEAWTDVEGGSLSMAVHTTALGCPCGWVPEQAVREECIPEKLGCRRALVVGRTLQGEDSSVPGIGSPEPWLASEHDRLALADALWNSWAVGRSLG